MSKKFDIPVLVRIEADSVEEAHMKIHKWMASPRDINNLPKEVNNLFHPDYDSDNDGQLVFYTGFYEWRNGTTQDKMEETINESITQLEHAALMYLKALETDYDDDADANEAMEKVTDDLKDKAILWAQGHILLEGFRKDSKNEISRTR